MNEIPKIMWYMDDPLADPACVPLYFVAKLARKHVTVVLSGEGADELFGGYNIYREPQSLEIFNKMPHFGKVLLRNLSKIMPEGMKGKSFIERGTTPMEERYIGNAKMFSQARRNVSYSVCIKTDCTIRILQSPFIKKAKAMIRLTPCNILIFIRGCVGIFYLKADRVTMAHSLELRVPFSR